MATRLVQLSAAVCVLWLAACVQDSGRSFNPLRSESVDSEVERRLGFEFDQELQRRVPLIDDPLVLGVLNELGQSIVRQIEPQPFIYRFRIVVNPELNAFAVPGGFVYLHSGTILSAASVGELAGVLGHEIGHVKGRHVARMQAEARIPNLLTAIAGIAATVATGEAGFAVAAQAINVAVQLRYTREFEDEADRIGSIFMARAGHDPSGMIHFFERLLLHRDGPGIEIPPYLYSHPELEDRIDSVRRFAADLSVASTQPAITRADLRAAQARLSLLLAAGRSSWPLASAPSAANETASLLREAEALAARDEPREALERVAAAEAIDPSDPQLPFRRAELLRKLGRAGEAIRAYEHALKLDPAPALTYFDLALAYKQVGNRVRATYYVEHALRRLPGRGALYQKASFELLKLSFPVITQSGMADGASSELGDTVAGSSRKRFSSSDERLAWWGRISPRWTAYQELMAARWIDPSGRNVQEVPLEGRGRPFVTAILPLGPELASRQGLWRIEILLDGDVVDRRTFPLTP